jgi:hypothetical protein
LKTLSMNGGPESLNFLRKTGLPLVGEAGNRM